MIPPLSRVAIFLAALAACGGPEQAEEAPAAPAVTDAEVEAACAHLEKILAEDNPEKARREAERCPESIRKTPAEQAKPFAECLATALDEQTLIDECMPLRR